VLGFKRFSNARRVLAGVDLVQKIIKGQFQVPERVRRFLGSSMIVNVARYSCAGYFSIHFKQPTMVRSVRVEDVTDKNPCS
jgi:hypothetical protein